MSGTVARVVRDGSRLLWLSTVRLVGRRFWVLPLATVLWPAFWWITLALGWREEDFSDGEVLPFLLGIPVCVLGIGLGVRVIAGEIEQRTVEIAYTVPGGAARLWTFKLAAGALLIAAAVALCGSFIFVFAVAYPFELLFAALLGATFYMVLAMWLAALTRSEVTGALLSAPLLVFGVFASETRFSPLFNPAGLETSGSYSSADLLAWTVQSRIGIVLAIAAVVFLAFGRAEQRERILGG